MGYGKNACRNGLVVEVLPRVAILSNFDIQRVLRGIVHFPPISTKVLDETTTLLINIFERSKDISSKDLIRPPCCSA